MKKVNIMNRLIIASAILLFAVFAGIGNCSENIVITRTLEGPVGPGEVFEVTLDVDISEDNKPQTYILSEEVPQGFEIVDTDARMTAEVIDDNTDHERSVMKWVVIEGLFAGKVEDARYVYHLRAPDTGGEYALIGSALLKDKTRVETIGSAGIVVDESIDNTVTGMPIVSFANAAPVVALIVVLSVVVLYFRKKTSAGNVK